VRGCVHRSFPRKMLRLGDIVMAPTRADLVDQADVPNGQAQSCPSGPYAMRATCHEHSCRPCWDGDDQQNSRRSDRSLGTGLAAGHALNDRMAAFWISIRSSSSTSGRTRPYRGSFGRGCEGVQLGQNVGASSDPTASN
jgi:hypothetical protein